MPTAEIIAIGSELTTGAKLDTNSQWLSTELAAAGIPTSFHTTIADNLADNIAAFRIAIDRCDVVLITGGLGPTLDDLTREAIAAVLGVPLELHAESLSIIEQMFVRRGRVMPERNRSQAMFPQGTMPIPNARGTAPGVAAVIPRPGKPACRLAALPGVPSEMRPMFREQVLAGLLADVPRAGVIRSDKLHCFGLGESAAEELLGDVTARGRDPEVGITVHEATITLRIEAVAETAAAADEKLRTTGEIIRRRMGAYFFGTGNDELQHAVLRELAARNESIAICEAETAGLLSRWCNELNTDFPGTVACCVCLPSVRALPWMIANGDSQAQTVAEQTASAATAMRLSCGATYGIAVSERVVDAAGTPTALIAVVTANETISQTVNLLGDPGIQRPRLAKAALDLLRLHLLKMSKA